MVFTPMFVPTQTFPSPAEPQVDPGDSAWHKPPKAAASCKLQAASQIQAKAQS